MHHLRWPTPSASWIFILSGLSICLIIVTLAVGLGVGMQQVTRQGMDMIGTERAGTHLRTWAALIQAVAERDGHLPPSLEACLATGDPASTLGLLDPWGSRIHYEVRGPKAFRLASNGPDGEAGTPDDILVHVADGGH